jgi:hypothetical protein
LRAAFSPLLSRTQGYFSLCEAVRARVAVHASDFQERYLFFSRRNPAFLNFHYSIFVTFLLLFKDLFDSRPEKFSTFSISYQQRFQLPFYSAFFPLLRGSRPFA